MDSPPLKSPVGTVLDERFEVLEPLAKGGMASVYLGLERETGRPVAIKVLQVEEGDDPGDFKARFEREAAILAELRHPNTVRIFDRGLDGEFHFLVMELIEGATLDERLGELRLLEPLRAIRILRQVCSALHEAHESGLIHRDLKPANLMLTERAGVEAAVVLDFGLVKVEGSDNTTRSGLRMGTPRYMAPEQINGDPVDRRADVYAMGLLLHLMLTGSAVFTGRKAALVMVAHLHNTPPTLSDHGFEGPASLDWTVQRCLEKQPGARFATMEELARALNVCELALRHPALSGVVPEIVGGQTRVPEKLQGADRGFDGVGELDPAALVTRRRLPVLALGGVAVALAVLAGGMLLSLVLGVWMLARG